MEKLEISSGDICKIKLLIFWGALALPDAPVANEPACWLDVPANLKAALRVIKKINKRVRQGMPRHLKNSVSKYHVEHLEKKLALYLKNVKEGVTCRLK
jgi:hypothetical protein